MKVLLGRNLLMDTNYPGIHVISHNEAIRPEAEKLQRAAMNKTQNKTQFGQL